VAVTELPPTAAGDAEVGQHERAVGPEQEVARLDVAVHDALRVGGGERVGRLRHEVHRVDRGQPAVPAERHRQGLALDVLHDQERALGVAAVVVDRDHAGVAQARHRPRLEQEPALEVGLVEQRGEHELHRHGAAEHGVGRPPDRAHAAGADALVQAVPAGQDPSSLVHPRLVDLTSSISAMQAVSRGRPDAQ
jgi:hypothetical protein